ncbi:MAG TPA: 23S rRNA (uracil(1939)-C(5))-methyltransferase RlmD [Clostridiales bacterium]|nr:23S rRNA (uracil(1939)-C(5))-methyltransferase RlmD [Clostridiales bacterium]
MLQKCPYAKLCGGCTYQGIEYSEQLKEKQSYVNKLLSQFGKVEDIIPAENPYYYRNKVHATYGYSKGSVVVGTYQENTHKLVPIDSCQIHNQTADAIVQDIKSLIKSFKYKTYDEDAGRGFFRHVLIRTGYSTGQVLVTLIVGDVIFPSKNNFVKALLKLHPEITTIVMNVNNKRTSMILGEREIVLYGKGYIEDVLCGKKFRISPKSFYQVNPIQTEIMYNKAIEYANLTGEERVIDAYCGIGTIGIIASDKTKEVIGVELNKDAFKDAIGNAKGNKINNIRFFNDDAGEFMVKLAVNKESVDVVFMDPPRAGSDEAFLKSLVTLTPNKVAYISCNPDTLSRDLDYLTKKGYKAEIIQPIEMFPFTDHVESIILMTYCGSEAEK